MLRTTFLCVLLLLLAPVAAAGTPPLDLYRGNGFTVSVPRGWKITVDEKQGVLVASGANDATLMLIAKAADASTTEDQLLDLATKQLVGFTVAARAALPGGRGHALVADGTTNNVQVRAGVVVLVENGRALIGLFAARTGDFDSLGGMELVTATLGSISIGTAPPAHKNPMDDAIEELGRQEKRGGRPDLPTDRAPLAKTAILGSWGRGAGSSYPVEEYRTPTAIYSHYNSSGEGELFTFNKDNTYTITHVTSIRQQFCQTKAVQFEHGTYSFDGKTLTMKVKDSYGIFSICSGKPAREEAKKLPGPRSYDIGMTDDGRIIFVGPACGAISELHCEAHARWDMRKK